MKLKGMKTQGKPPRKKTTRKPASPAAGQESRPVETAPDPRVARPAENPQAPSKEEVITTWTEPLTNQAEQEKITNAPDDDIPVAKE